METKLTANLPQSAKTEFDMANVSTWIMSVCGMITGCLAYIDGIPFIHLQISNFLKEGLDALWAVFVAILTGAAGAFGIHCYNVKLKNKVGQWLKRKKK